MVRSHSTIIKRYQNPLKRGSWVKWDKPLSGWFKLNIDGSAREELITGGGIVRNFEGTILAGFSNFYGKGSNNSFRRYGMDFDYAKDFIYHPSSLRVAPSAKIHKQLRFEHLESLL